jgi:hypothetical protein
MDFSEIMKQASKIQEQMKSAKENLVKIECDGKSGGGLVKLTLNGDNNIVNIDIDKSIIEDNEKEIIEDLIIAAFNDAKAKLNDEIANKMKDITGGLPLPPGFNMGF